MFRTLLCLQLTKSVNVWPFTSYIKKTLVLWDFIDSIHFLKWKLCSHISLPVKSIVDLTPYAIFISLLILIGSVDFETVVGATRKSTGCFQILTDSVKFRFTIMLLFFSYPCYLTLWVSKVHLTFVGNQSMRRTTLNPIT